MFFVSLMWHFIVAHNGPLFMKLLRFMACTNNANEINC
jgi:hypothetical protein